MLIGVLSDTHDRAEPTRLAVDLLLAKGAEALIHCGDVCTEPILDLLVSPIPVYFVFGNNEPDPRALAHYARHLGLHCLGEQGTVNLGNRTFGITHGDVPARVRALRDAEVHYLLSGHTHVAHDQQAGCTRLINPGAIHRTRQRSVALIDTDRDAVTFHTF